MTAGGKVTEIIELVGGDTVAGVRNAVVILGYPECCPGGSADTDDQRLRGNVSGTEIDGLVSHFLFLISFYHRVFGG